MFTLGVYSARGAAAAAIATEGRIVSAVSIGGGTIPGVSDDEMLAAVKACLATGNIDPGRVTRAISAGPVHAARTARGWVVAAGIDIAGRPIEVVAGDVAHATFLRGFGAGRRVGLVLSGEGAGLRGSWVQMCDQRCARIEPLAWASEIERGIRTAVVALGGSNGDGVAFLEGVARESGVAPAGAIEGLFEVSGCDRVLCNRQGFRRRIAQARRDSAGLLAADGQHVSTQRARAALAGDVLNSLARAVADVALRKLADLRADQVMVGGSLLGSAAFQARLHGLLGAPAASIPAASGMECALGAALHESTEIGPFETLALGSDHDEQAIKTALENCRLEYVYEPDWSRLRSLVSRLLSAGAFVGWFQGPCDFGPVSYGSRSVLADPSRPYARDNIRSHLMRGDARSAIPVSFARRDVRNGQNVFAPRLETLAVSPALSSTADSAGRVTVMPVHEAELVRLLDVHRERTGIPGLVALPLRGMRTPLAWTPAEAIARVFASAVDVAVLGRFIVAKDYWLLRHHAA